MSILVLYIIFPFSGNVNMTMYIKQMSMFKKQIHEVYVFNMENNISVLYRATSAVLFFYYYNL